MQQPPSSVRPAPRRWPADAAPSSAAVAAPTPVAATCGGTPPQPSRRLPSTAAAAALLNAFTSDRGHRSAHATTSAAVATAGDTFAAERARDVERRLCAAGGRCGGRAPALETGGNREENQHCRQAREGCRPHEVGHTTHGLTLPSPLRPPSLSPPHCSLFHLPSSTTLTPDHLSLLAAWTTWRAGLFSLSTLPSFHFPFHPHRPGSSGLAAAAGTANGAGSRHTAAVCLVGAAAVALVPGWCRCVH